MRLQHIKEALEHVRHDVNANGVTVLTKENYYTYKRDEELAVIDQMLTDIAELEERLKPNDDLWHGVVWPISQGDLIDIINVNGYDMYGELYRENNNKVPTVEAYIQRCRNKRTFDDFTDGMISEGYYLLVDLFGDNEALGYNDDEGHFDGGTPAKSIL